MEESDHSSNSCHTDSYKNWFHVFFDSIFRFQWDLFGYLEEHDVVNPALKYELKNNIKLEKESELKSVLKSALKSAQGPMLEPVLESVPESTMESALEYVLNSVHFRNLVKIAVKNPTTPQSPAWKRSALQFFRSEAADSLYMKMLLEREKMKPILRPEEVANITREAAERSEFFHKLFRFICHVTRLLMLFCLYIVAYGKTKARFKYTYEKASLLILWHCGDVERNPGPGLHTISDISRDFCKKMISLLIIRYWEHKEGRNLTQADYKKRPEEWAEDIWYGDPSTCTNEKRNAMLKGLCNVCLVLGVAIPNEWLVLIDKYERFKDKQCSKTEEKKYVKDLKSWLHQRRTLEAVDHVFDRLPEDSEGDKYCILRHVFERLKQHLPDLNSKILQSRKTENEPVISQDTSNWEQCSYTDLSVNGSVPVENNSIHADGRKVRINNNITAQIDSMSTPNHSAHVIAKLLPDIHENGKAAYSTVQADPLNADQGWLEGLLADSVISFMQYPIAYVEETHWSNNKACQRKDAFHEGSDIMVSLSKRQKCSEDFDLPQSTEKTDRMGAVVSPHITTTENEDCTDTTWDDLMDIIQPRIQEDTTRPEDIPVTVLDTAIHDDIPGDIEELSIYLFG